MEKGVQNPMAQGRSTKTSSRCGGLGPVGCQQRALSLSGAGLGTMLLGLGVAERKSVVQDRETESS